MPSSIEQIVRVVISQETQAVPQVGFGIPLIMGTSNRFAELVRYYSSAAAMLADGFTTSDPEYVRALKAFSQSLSPTQIGVGKYTTPIAQVERLTVNDVQDNTIYSATINGILFSIDSGSGATAASILAAIASAINAGSEPVTAGAVVSNHIDLTADNPGEGFTLTVSAKLTITHITSNHSIADDIAALQNVSDVWYGLSICSNLKSDILQVAAYIESQKKIFIASSSDADILTTATDDVASTLKAFSYKRTALLYSAEANGGPEAAWLGGQLPQTPGASTWKFKTLVGVTPDDLTQTERNNVIGTPDIPAKNGNIYETVGGVPITEEGWMASGQFIDITIGLDWLEATMQTNVFVPLANSPKVPYTDLGVAVIENAIRQTLQTGVNNGLIDGNSPLTVSAPKVLDIPANTRAQRVLPDMKFSCRLAGALHFVQIDGTVTV